MKHFAAILPFLLLAPACFDDLNIDATSIAGTAGPDITRGEVCDDMQLCMRNNCNEQLQAIRDCPSDMEFPLCLEDLELRAQMDVDLAQCVVDAGCNMTSCDLVAMETDDVVPNESFCGDADDVELYEFARLAAITTDLVMQCQDLE